MGMTPDTNYCERLPQKTIQEVLASFGSGDCNSCGHFKEDDYGSFYCDLIGNSFTDCMSKGVDL